MTHMHLDNRIKQLIHLAKHGCDNKHVSTLPKKKYKEVLFVNKDIKHAGTEFGEGEDVVSGEDIFPFSWCSGCVLHDECDIFDIKKSAKEKIKQIIGGIGNS